MKLAQLEEEITVDLSNDLTSVILKTEQRKNYTS